MNETKKCTKCQENLPLNRFYFHRGRKAHMDSCIRCNSKNKASLEYQSRKRKEMDYKYTLRQRACCIRRECKTRKHGTIEVAADLGDLLIKQYESQAGRCYYTGEPITFKNYHVGNASFATVDRINNKLGYVKGNIVFCKSSINRMKQDLSWTDLEVACNQLLKFIREKTPVMD